LGELLNQSGVHGNAASLAALVVDWADAMRPQLTAGLDGIVANTIDEKTLGDILGTADRARLGALMGRELASLLTVRARHLRRLPLATILDGLNSYEPVLEGSSDLLVSLFDHHLASVLSGRVARTVAANLDELPDDRLREMVEDFMGEHLGPITWLGAIVGGSIGTVLYYLQTLGWNATGYLQAALVYGFAGWVTNVMALWAIFRPYEEKRVLGLPLPLTPGVVAQNKPRFAESMGEFVDEKLLSLDSLRQAFRDSREEADEALRAYFYTRGPKLILEALSANDNVRTISNAAVTLARDGAGRSREQIAPWLARVIADVPLGQFDLEAVGDAASNLLWERLDDVPAFLSAEIADLANTDSSIGDMLPGFIRSALYEQLDSAVRAQLALLEQLLADPQKAQQTLTTAVQPVFEDWSERSVAELATPGKTSLAERLAVLVVEGLSIPERRAALVDWLQALLDKSEAERTVAELAGGSLVRLASEHSDVLVDVVVERGLDLLGRHRDAIKSFVASALQEGNPLFAVFNLRRVTDEVVDRVIDDKLPAYMERHYDDSQNLVDGFITSVGEQPLGDLGLETALCGLDHLLKGLVDGPEPADNVARLLQPVVGPVGDVPLRSLLGLLRLSRFGDVLDRFKGEFELTTQHLSKRLDEHRQDIETTAANMGGVILDTALDELSGAALVRGIPTNLLEACLTGLVNRLRSSPAFRSAVDHGVQRWCRRIAACTAGDFVAPEILAEDLGHLVDSLLANEDLFEALLPEVESTILTMGKAVPELVDAETWDYIVSVVVEALVNAVQSNLARLVDAVDLAEVTEEQLKDMSPAKIEELFNSFASGYFTRLRLYGWFGAGFGVVVEALRQTLM